MMIIRDAIHNDIEVEPGLISDLIRTYEFQRLRKIKQLGLTYTIFPSAEHTRYSHSLGVYHLTCRMINVIEARRNVRFEKLEAESLKAAALLHDIGHGPLSHTAEECFGYSHEEYSVKIIRDKQTQINQVLRQYDPEMIENIAMYIEKKHPSKILNQVLSATIDVDRMDYLIRDSHHVGVVYGNFDVNRLLKIVAVKDNQLVFLRKGKQTIEDFILSRYHMFGQVYLNEHTIGNQLVVKRILMRIRDLYESKKYTFKVNIDKLIPFFSDEIPVINYIQMNDYVLMSIIEDIAYMETDHEISELAKSFMKQQPLVFEKEDGKNYYEFKSDNYQKKIYNESVKILDDDGTIINLEDISQLVKFIKDGLKIQSESKTYYLERNES